MSRRAPSCQPFPVRWCFRLLNVDNSGLNWSSWSAQDPNGFDYLHEGADLSCELPTDLVVQRQNCGCSWRSGGDPPWQRKRGQREEGAICNGWVAATALPVAAGPGFNLKFCTEVKF
eukprot:2318414-Rhodomonas_salina.4